LKKNEEHANIGYSSQLLHFLPFSLVGRLSWEKQKVPIKQKENKYKSNTQRNFETLVYHRFTINASLDGFRGKRTHNFFLDLKSHAVRNKSISDAWLFCKNKQVNLKTKQKTGNLTEKQAQHALAGKFSRMKNQQEN